MDGLITTRHLFFYAPEIISGFGWETYMRCLKSALLHRHSTFLDVIFVRKVRGES